MEPFGVRLNRLIKMQGSSQAKLAALIGESRQTVNHWVSGQSRPSVDLIPQITSALGVPVGILFGEAMQEEGEAFQRLEFINNYRRLQEAKKALDAALYSMERQAARAGLEIDPPRYEIVESEIHRNNASDLIGSRRNSLSRESSGSKTESQQ